MNYSCNVTVQHYSLVREECVWGLGGGVTAVILVFIDFKYDPLHGNTTCLELNILNVQGVTGGTDQTLGGCSLC